MIPVSVQNIALGVALTLFVLWAWATLERHWPKIMRWLRIARIWMHRDKLGVMHFGTIHGDLSVRLDSEDNTIEDIQQWLHANDLNASVSKPTLKAVIKRVSENKRRK